MARETSCDLAADILRELTRRRVRATLDELAGPIAQHEEAIARELAALGVCPRCLGRLDLAEQLRAAIAAPDVRAAVEAIVAQIDATDRALDARG